jgi:hypothetical protein
VAASANAASSNAVEEQIMGRKGFGSFIAVNAVFPI